MDITTMLKNAVESGILDPVKLQEELEMYEIKKYLDQHPYDIWQGKNGYWYTYLPPKDADPTAKRRLVKKKTESSVQQTIVAFYKGLENIHLVKDVFNEWIAEKSKYSEISDQTITKYKADYKKCFVGTVFNESDISKITSNDIEKFVKDTIHEHHLTQKAWSNVRIVLSGIFRRAKSKCYTDLSISSVLEDIELSKKIFQVNTVAENEQIFRPDELDKIKKYVHEHGERLTDMAIILAMSTGMRVGEIVVLKQSDIHENYIDVNKTEIRYKDAEGIFHTEIQNFTKTKAGLRKVVIQDNVHEIIKTINRLNDGGEFLFMHDNGQLLRGTSVSKRLRSLCSYVGIPVRSTHKIRRAYATKLINNHVDEKIVMKQMGHTDITTTKKYYYYNDKTETEAIHQIKDALKSVC